jgi:predicted transcriptional regulator
MGEIAMPPDGIGNSKILSLTAEVSAAFVGNNSLPTAELPTLIKSVYGVLASLASQAAAQARPLAAAPAISVRKSITPDYLICLEDGRRFKSLRRHLARLGMTPEQYREKWNLPFDYPMVARNYSIERSALAKKSGLGNRRRKHQPAKASSIRNHS